MNKYVKIISNTLYFIGVLTICLILLFIFTDSLACGAYFPFFMLVAGSFPMLLSCHAVYRFNGVKESKHKKKIFILIFIPGFICSAVALHIIGVVFYGFVLFIFKGLGK